MNLLNEWMFVIGWFSRISSLQVTDERVSRPKKKKANYCGPDQIWYQDQVTLWVLVWVSRQLESLGKLTLCSV